MKLKLHAMAALALSVAGSCVLVQSVQAQFTYQSRDLMLTFRKTGSDGVGTVGPVVLEVDIGQASQFYGAAQGTVIPITSYSATTQLGLFDNLDDLSWSVGGCVPNAGDSGDPSIPTSTLWVTEPRTTPTMQASPPWHRSSKSIQGLADGKISSVINDAGIWAAPVPADSVTNSTTAVAIQYGNADNANGSLGGSGNYLGYFQGVVENTTASDFIYSGSTSCSDLYQLEPGSGSGTYLGYFQLNTDGTMVFNAPSAVVVYPAPTLSVSSSAGSVTISFQSTLGGTYTLYSTSAGNLTTPCSSTSWTSVATMTGDGSVDQFPSQTISGTGTVYAVSVQ